MRINNTTEIILYQINSSFLKSQFPRAENNAPMIMGIRQLDMIFTNLFFKNVSILFIMYTPHHYYYSLYYIPISYIRIDGTFVLLFYIHL